MAQGSNVSEEEWKEAFKAEMHAAGVGHMAEEEAEYQWLACPHVEQVDPVKHARKVAPAYYK